MGFLPIAMPAYIRNNFGPVILSLRFCVQIKNKILYTEGKLRKQNCHFQDYSWFFKKNEKARIEVSFSRQTWFLGLKSDNFFTKNKSLILGFFWAQSVKFPKQIIKAKSG